MPLVNEAFYRMFPQDENNFLFELKYSGKFKAFNANVKLRNNKIMLCLSREWRDVSKEIQIGLIQVLLSRILKRKIKTFNIDLYHSFVKRIDAFTPAVQSDEILEGSFNRVNEKYFFRLIEKPNLEWHDSSRKYGVYDFHTNTISISKMLRGCDGRYLDYIMHHEMLHKKMKFKNNAVRTLYHSAAFRTAEKSFENAEEIERGLKFLSVKKRLF